MLLTSASFISQLTEIEKFLSLSAMKNSLYFAAQKPVKNMEELIGSTPILQLKASLQELPLGSWLKEEKGAQESPDISSELYAKVEYFNPGGSVKDRIAQHILDQAEKRGEIKPGATIVESTSGNTGAGLAMIAALRGYKAILVMPDKMSAEKINALRAYGAKVVVCPTAVEPEDPKSYYSVARRIAKETPNSFLANQYYNPDNPETHYLSTGPEIWEQMEGKIDAFFVGLGTGGTMSGCARYLKEKNPEIKIIGVDPVGSIYYKLIKEKKMSEAKSYLLEGVGEDIIPDTIDLKLVDDVVWIRDFESFAATRMLAQKEGLFVGGSCGFAFYGAAQYLQFVEKEYQQKWRSVVLMPDSGAKYLSKVFNDSWLESHDVQSSWGEYALGAPVEYIDGANKVAGV